MDGAGEDEETQVEERETGKRVALRFETSVKNRCENYVQLKA